MLSSKLSVANTIAYMDSVNKETVAASDCGAMVLHFCVEIKCSAIIQ